MPQLITFAGRPVKRRRRVSGGLLLSLYGAARHVAGEQLVVSDDEWRRHGRITFYESGMLPDVRMLVSKSTPKSWT